MPDRQIVQKPRPVYGRARSDVYRQTFSGAGTVKAVTSPPWRPRGTMTGVHVLVGTADTVAKNYVVLKNGVAVAQVTLAGSARVGRVDCLVEFNGTTDVCTVQTPDSTAVDVTVELEFGTTA